MLGIQLVRGQLGPLGGIHSHQAGTVVEAGRNPVGGADQDVRAAVLEDVAELALPEFRVHRDHRRAGRQSADEADAALEARLGPHADALGAGNAAGDRSAAGAQLSVGERTTAHPQRGLAVAFVQWRQKWLAARQCSSSQWLSG